VGQFKTFPVVEDKESRRGNVSKLPLLNIIFYTPSARIKIYEY